MKTKPKALLISIKTPDVTDSEAKSSIEELSRLVQTLGFEEIGRASQKMPSTTGASAVGAGKLKELAQIVEAQEQEGALVLVFDCDLKPSQLKNIENAVGAEVLDRTGVIIEIFSRHAKTRAARIQVEIARLNYVSPRLREAGPSGERQQGRGSGETALATERRAIRDRLAELKTELAQVQKEQAGRRSTRAQQRSVALVGYTNAGKSSLMRALTGSEVLVENKLFATLDTTVRIMKPETNPRILVSDTVGFIKKLPHDLVASFRSTLDEATNAELLLYVVDSSDPDFSSQLKTVEETLEGSGQSPVLLVLNKSDLLSEIQRKRVKTAYPDGIFISALDKKSVANLRDRILAFFEREMVEAEIFAPYDLKGFVGALRENLRVLRESNTEKGTRYVVRGKPGEIERLKKKFGLS